VDLSTVYDNLGVCKFMYSSDVGPTTLLAWMRAGLGWEMTREELSTCGERSYTLKHLFNIDRLGIKPAADLPKRVLYETRGEGGAAKILPDLPAMLKEYYEFRGWSQDGYPPDNARPLDLSRELR
jgi:aldehyde:ferredoxin oxidoreductase